MPIDSELAYRTYNRYSYVRDNGHTKFVEKADKCDRFFRGEQWDPADLAALKAVRRPALTINKILSTVGNVMGEQINNRAEVSFRPRSGANPDTADILTKVFKQISDNNQLDWKRSDMFADGVISSRGFLDIRLAYNDNMEGEVRIENLNPKNVLIDPDADEYDPDSWSEVFITKWLTADDIAVLYSKEDADLLRNRSNSAFPYGYDSIQSEREGFGGQSASTNVSGYDMSNVMRSVRVVERQFRQLDNVKHFMDPRTGDMRAVPDGFDRDRIAFFVDNFGLRVVKKLTRRIRWSVIADDVRLHDDWSPYQHFTPVPYFPQFRYGKTIGIVENLLDPQELLNKTTSQELHVANTTANSGYKVRAGALANMTVAELEQKGAQTGLVVEINGDPDKDLQKITPNQVPQGLDRISYKAEEAIKSISGISDSMQGMDRADVAAKAIQAKRQAGSTNLVKPLDNLTRTDFIVARNVLDLVQKFYTEPRILTITHDSITGETETFGINQPDEADPYHEIRNDLTLGEYDVVVTSVPHRETLEDSQFEQALSMREAGIGIPDEVLVDASRLFGKKDIIKKMQTAAQSPEAQAAAQLQQRLAEAEAAKTEAEAGQKAADAQLKGAKTQETMAKAHTLLNPAPENDGGAAMVQDKKISGELALKAQDQDHKQSVEERKLALEREKMDREDARAERELQANAQNERIKAVAQAAAAAAKPAGGGNETANRSRLPTSKSQL